MLIATEATISGAITRASDMPELLMAISSLLSPIIPITIIADRSVASGRARGRMVHPPSSMNSSTTPRPRPLPTSSSIYTQRNCIIRMNMTMSRIAKNGPMNDVSMNLSSLFKSCQSLCGGQQTILQYPCRQR